MIPETLSPCTVTPRLMEQFVQIVERINAARFKAGKGPVVADLTSGPVKRRIADDYEALLRFFDEQGADIEVFLLKDICEDLGDPEGFL